MHFLEEGFNLEPCLACVKYEKEGKVQFRQNFVHNVLYSKKSWKCFANSACLFRLSRKGQKLTNHPPPSLVIKNQKLGNPPSPPCQKNSKIGWLPPPSLCW